MNYLHSIYRNTTKQTGSRWKMMKPVQLLNTAENPCCSVEIVLGSRKVAHFLM